MSRETCKHGVAIDSERYLCAACMDERGEEKRRKRRAEWIRNNVACFFDGNDMGEAVNMAEYMADKLIARGYL